MGNDFKLNIVARSSVLVLCLLQMKPGTPPWDERTSSLVAVGGQGIGQPRGQVKNLCTFSIEGVVPLVAQYRYHRRVRPTPRWRSLVFKLMCRLVPCQLRDQATLLFVVISLAIVLKKAKAAIRPGIHPY